MVQRLTYRKRHSYATKSIQTRVVKTPDDIPLPTASDFLAAIPVLPSVNSVLNFALRSVQEGGLYTSTPTRGRAGRNARKGHPGGKPLHAIPFETAQQLVLIRATFIRIASFLRLKCESSAQIVLSRGSNLTPYKCS
jgi:hypothetical protein